MSYEKWQRSRNPARLLSIRTSNCQRRAAVLQQPIRFPDSQRSRRKISSAAERPTSLGCERLLRDLAPFLA